MKDSQNSDPIRFHAIIHAVREAPDYAATNILEHALMDLRSRSDSFQNLLDPFREFLPKPDSLFLVPIIGLVKFGSCIPLKYYWETHCCDLARASALMTSQGTASSG